MLRECKKCPGPEKLKTFIYSLYDEEDIDDSDEVNYKQWVHTDRTMLETITSTVGEFLDKLGDNFDQLRTHHYIARAQSAFLKCIKESITCNDLVILLDYAENYSFVVQDAVQGQHWNNRQATLHPFVIYYNLNGQQQIRSYCVISDSLDHSASSVHAFISALLEDLKKQDDFREMKHVIYFSDGAASQYKNCKNFRG